MGIQNGKRNITPLTAPQHGQVCCHFSLHYRTFARQSLGKGGYHPFQHAAECMVHSFLLEVDQLNSPER